MLHANSCFICFLPLFAFPTKFQLCQELSQILICFTGTTGRKPVLRKGSTSAAIQYFHISVFFPSQLLDLFTRLFVITQICTSPPSFCSTSITFSPMIQHSCLDLLFPCLLSIISLFLHHSHFSQFVLHFRRLADSLAKRHFLSSSSSLVHMSLPSSHLFLNIFSAAP